MKKDTSRVLIVTALLVAVYNLIAFMIPFAHCAAFWISYGFTMAAFVVVFAAVYIAFIKNPDVKSRFYGFPIARIGLIYGAAQLVVSLVVMALGQILPWWVPTLVYAIAFAAAIIGLISAEAVVEEIQTLDVKQKKDVALMRSLHAKVSQMANQSGDAGLKALADEFRYSDPVSNEAIADIEAEIVSVVDELRNAYVTSDKEKMDELCRKAGLLLSERNRLCKLNKH